MKPYHELTRLGRLRRLRQLAQVALEAYDLSGAPLTFLQYRGNVIFRVDASPPVPVTSNKGPYIENRYVLRVLTMDDRPHQERPRQAGPAHRVAGPGRGQAPALL
jgi:hypothetical protein